MSALVSDVFYFNQLSELKDKANFLEDLLVFDEKLLSVNSFKDFINSFKYSYGVQAGEELKNIHNFPEHISQILEVSKDISFKSSKIIVMGGGSVGDFGGFVASTLKRGVPLVHIPTTWLAAMDSSHGGKTALNVGEYKNQVGSFYSAGSVLIVKEILESNPGLLKQQAWGEAFKMLLISGQDNNSKSLWELLPALVTEKYIWVKKDPYEKLGDRQVLNLGHTVGHVFEVLYNLSHGWAVAQGLHFSLRWSEKLFGVDLSSQKKSLQSKIPFQFSQDNKKLNPLNEKEFVELLLQDKKKTAKNSVNFIFVDKNLKPIIQSVNFSEVLTEAKAQGWVLS